MLRQYFPKGADLNAYGPEDLEHVAQELNAQPRKTLDWDTPAERLTDSQLSTGVATTPGIQVSGQFRGRLRAVFHGR